MVSLCLSPSLRLSISHHRALPLSLFLVVQMPGSIDRAANSFCFIFRCRHVCLCSASCEWIKLESASKQFAFNHTYGQGFRIMCRTSLLANGEPACSTAQHIKIKIKQNKLKLRLSLTSLAYRVHSDDHDDVDDDDGTISCTLYVSHYRNEPSVHYLTIFNAWKCVAYNYCYLSANSNKNLLFMALLTRLSRTHERNGIQYSAHTTPQNRSTHTHTRCVWMAIFCTFYSTYTIDGCSEQNVIIWTRKCKMMCGRAFGAEFCQTARARKTDKTQIGWTRTHEGEYKKNMCICGCGYCHCCLWLLCVCVCACLCDDGTYTRHRHTNTHTRALNSFFDLIIVIRKSFLINLLRNNRAKFVWKPNEWILISGTEAFCALMNSYVMHFKMPLPFVFAHSMCIQYSPHNFCSHGKQWRRTGMGDSKQIKCANANVT